jgi:hypothetical protein
MREMRNAYKILVGNLTERDHPEEVGIDERIMSRVYLRERQWEDVEWIRLAQDRDQWQVLMNMMRSFGLHERWGFLDSLNDY